MENENGFARNTDPSTSHAAASSVKTAHIEKVVLDAIGKFPDGCIADDLEQALPGMRWNTITPRLRPLIKKGLVFDTGERRTGKSGRSQRVLKASTAH